MLMETYHGKCLESPGGEGREGPMNARVQARGGVDDHLRYTLLLRNERLIFILQTIII